MRLYHPRRDLIPMAGSPRLVIIRVAGARLQENKTTGLDNMELSLWLGVDIKMDGWKLQILHIAS